MVLSALEYQRLNHFMAQYQRNGNVQQMKLFIQHGAVTTYDHCKNVVCVSFWMNCKLKLRADEQALVTGAFLHDFYLYDWHKKDCSHRLHGFAHPKMACENARVHFQINKKEQGIILSHMWPLTLTNLPMSREAVIVCIADKYCALLETVFRKVIQIKIKASK